MEKTHKFLKPIIILDKPRTSYDIKPEVWNIIDTNKNYLVYYPLIISTRLISYKPSDIGFKFESRNTIYLCDWAPTLRMVSKEDFNKVRNSI